LSRPPHRRLPLAAAWLWLWLWLGCALPAWAAEHAPAPQAAGHATPQAHARAKGAPPAAPAESPVQALVRRYDSAQVVVMQQQLCLMRPGCATDEGRLLDALAASRQVLQTLADMSQAGDVEAAYERGLLGLRAAQTHTARSQAETDAQFPATAAVLRRRRAQEFGTAQLHLARAAAQGHPGACLALAEHLGARQPQPEPALVARLFRCAVIGSQARGDRAGAIQAYARMRDTLSPDEPLLIEAHSVIYRNLPPDRPWRQVEPDEALALRRQVAP